ncbi:MAG: hypothetical protein Tsb0013_24530 [Phycisphaerales bacterium]
MHHTLTVAVLLAIGCAGPVAAQPALDPPAGPIGESGRFGTLIELSQASTPGDADSVFRISEPGSYVLTSDLTVPANQIGIEIAANDVTIDLNGYSVSGDVATSTGVGVTLPTLVSETFTNLLVSDGSFRDLANSISTLANVRAEPDDLTNRIEGVTARRVRVTDVSNGMVLANGRIEDSVVQAQNIGISLENGTIDGCSVTISAPGPVAAVGISVGGGSVRNSSVVIDNTSSTNVTGIRLRDADATDCTVLLSGANAVGFGSLSGTALASRCSVRLFFPGSSSFSFGFDVDGVVVDCIATGTTFGYRVDEGVVRGSAAIDVTTPSVLGASVVTSDNNF